MKPRPPEIICTGTPEEIEQLRAELLAIAAPAVVGEIMRRAPVATAPAALPVLERAVNDVTRPPEPPAVYTTKASPPDCSRRTFNETCRTGAVEGATKLGRVWQCSHDAWQRARAVETIRRSPPRTIEDEELLALVRGPQRQRAR
jgi:hypothetical protein